MPGLHENPLLRLRNLGPASVRMLRATMERFRLERLPAARAGVLGAHRERNVVVATPAFTNNVMWMPIAQQWNSALGSALSHVLRRKCGVLSCLALRNACVQLMNMG